ncbi:hypothetical protein ABH924_004635 [Arthrobacter sp. GAS37]|uniref:hypothetical protein n=1 Tax=Arthrobacter sp. GAS37 TaxID=3156261 RepID=UPI0038340B8A
MKNPIREVIEQFREEFPGGVREFLQVLREDRAERRAERQRRRRLSPQERALEDIALSSRVHRAEVTDGVIFTEDKAQEVMEQLHGKRLRYVEFDDGLTVAILKGGRRLEYDEAGRLIS